MVERGAVGPGDSSESSASPPLGGTMPRTLGMDGLVPSSPRQRGRARPGSAAGSMYDSDPHSQDNLLNMAWLEKLQQMDPEKVTDWDEVGAGCLRSLLPVGLPT